MSKYCMDCGKKQKNTEYDFCYQCYQETEKNTPEKKEEGIDLTKIIKIPVWVLMLCFIIGIIIGAWLF